MTIREYVEQLMNYLTVPIVDILIEENDEFIFVEIEVPEEDAGKMIGKHGDTIAALGHILGIVFRSQTGEKRVVVDINGYKQRREDEAVDDAVAAAERVVATGRPYHMSNTLQPHQRRVIHQELQEFAGVFTRSEGEGRMRHLVIYPESMRAELMDNEVITVEESSAGEVEVDLAQPDLVEPDPAQPENNSEPMVETEIAEPDQITARDRE